jgi:predicted Rossmann-fold nucleotide-binding protein
LQHKMAALLNVGGYFDPLVQFIDRAVTEGFLKPAHRERLLIETDAMRLLERLSS